MPRPKSLLHGVTVDRAGRSHNCQHVVSHRVNMGDKRLKVKNGRTHEHFCQTCAIRIIESDIAKLEELKRQLLD